MLNNKWCQWGRGQLLGKGAPGEDPLSSYQSVMKEPPSHIMKTRPRNLCVAAEENFEGKTSWREGVTVPICIPGILLSPCPQPWGYGWAQKGNFFSLFPLSWHFLNELLPNSEEEQNGMSIKNTNSVKIPRKYKFLILRAISPFVTGSWYGAHGPCWLSSALFLVYQPWDSFPQACFSCLGIKNGSHLDSEVVFCLGACLVVVLTGEGEALWAGEMDLTFPSRPVCACCL